MEEPVRTLISHQTWLRSLARRLVRSHTAAEDLVQETCITALRKAPPGTDMRPWLRGVMRNLASHYVRSERRRAVREESFHRSRSSSAAPDGVLEYGVDRVRLREIVESLPEPFRSTVVQRYLEGLSCAEIARAERVPPGTVRWRQSRALELLRTELEAGSHSGRPRRRHLVHWWPFAGAGQSLMADRSSLSPLSRNSKVLGLGLGLGLAGLVAIMALGVRTGAGQRGPSARVSGGDLPGGLSLTGSSALAAALDRPGGGAPGARASAGWRADASQAARAPTGSALGPGDGRSRTEQLMDEYELALYDCEIDRDEILRCHRDAIRSDFAAVATCRLLVRSLGAIELGGRHGVRSSHSRRFLAAASAANRSLAGRLGCDLAADPHERAGPAEAGLDGEPRSHGGPAPEDEPDAHGESAKEGASADHRESTDEGESTRDSQPTCETEVRQGGEECTTCTDESGSDGFCGPVKCTSSIEQDGAACTTCTDVHGHVETSCTGGTWESGCVSVVQEYGLLCSTCPGDGASPPECLVASCHVKDRCLECRDPKGRVASDCSRDHEGQPGESTTVGGGDTFNLCDAHWGTPTGAGGTCHYPGTQTCAVSEGGGVRCIDCKFPDGAASALCLLDPALPLLDPMAGRPSWLPAPGDCVTETREDGVQCSSCTASDLRATISCRFPPAIECTTDQGNQPGQACLSCALEGGGRVMLCDEAGT